MTQQEVIDLMKASSTRTEWNQNCDKVKKAFGGDYPKWWYHTIVVSGIAHDVQQSWKQSA